MESTKMRSCHTGYMSKILRSERTSFITFMKEVIHSLHQAGKYRLSETYTTSLNCFMRFCNGNDVSFAEMNEALMISYESYLQSLGVTPNTSSFYMRNLRAVYNRAVDRNLVMQRYPFKNVYTGVAKTSKRAVSLEMIRLLKNMRLSGFHTLDFARDMFLFSFYLRGMSFVDMAYLKKKDLNNGLLSYRRRKTGQTLFIGWEPCMQEIVNKYSILDSVYLLPIIKYTGVEERKQYLNASHTINRSLKIIGKRLDISIPLTMYVARHTWASVARSKHIPLSVISESMGHDSEKTTRIYLASLDNEVVNNANKLILASL